MVYTMEYQVDGACRGNGYSDAVGAAAACLIGQGGKHLATRTQILDTSEYCATNQRAEILAMIVALEWALDRYDDLDERPRLNVKIYSDSKYAVGCMDEWVYTWASNGWRNARGNEIANVALIKEASALDDRVQELGTVSYTYVPRKHNQLADKACNDALDDLDDA